MVCYVVANPHSLGSCRNSILDGTDTTHIDHPAGSSCRNDVVCVLVVYAMIESLLLSACSPDSIYKVYRYVCSVSTKMYEIKNNL